MAPVEEVTGYEKKGSARQNLYEKKMMMQR